MQKACIPPKGATCGACLVHKGSGQILNQERTEEQDVKKNRFFGKGLKEY